MKAAEIQKEINIIAEEIEGLKDEKCSLERRLFALQEDLAYDTEILKKELRSAALDILQVAEYKLGGGDLDALYLAINKSDLSKDQMARVKLLAREFLYLTITNS